jgi:glutamyl-tRNA synthetase
VSRFTLEGISGGNAVFNTEKLDWFNYQYLLRLGDDELIVRLRPWLEKAGYWRDALLGQDRDWLVKVLAQLRPRAKRLNEFIEQIEPFFKAPAAYDPVAVSKHLSAAGIRGHVAALREAVAEIGPFDESTLEITLRHVAETRGIKAGALIHATRIAMTGRMVSPGLFEMLALLGRDTVTTRLDRLISFLSATA